MAADRRTRSALRWKDIQTTASISCDDPSGSEIRRLTIAPSAKTSTAPRLGCNSEVCDEERVAHPGYFKTVAIDDPSVITLNSTIASLADTVGCDMIVPTMRPVTNQDSYRYNAAKGLVCHVANPIAIECAVCGIEGRAALADDLPLPS